MADGTRKQPQHAPHALEVAERRRLAGECLQHLRVQRIACPERLGVLGPCRVGCERLAVCCPERAVRFDRGLDARSVDVLEQAPAQHLDGLVLFGRIEQRGLARRHALRFAHLIGDELVLLAVGVARPSVLADRERVDERGVRCAFDGLEQRGQECGELVPRIPHPPDLSEVDREFVEQDERRLATEQLAQRLRPGRNARLVALADPLVAIPSGERTGDLAPRRVGQYVVVHGPAVGRIGVLAVEGGDAHSAFRQQRRIDELGDVRHGPEPARGVGQRDQAVRLAAAIGGIEAEDCSHFAAGPGKPSADVPEQALEPSCRVAVGEEPYRVPVLRASLPHDHRGQIGCEVRFRDLAPEHVAARRAGVEDCRSCHRLPSELNPSAAVSYLGPSSFGGRDLLCFCFCFSASRKRIARSVGAHVRWPLQGERSRPSCVRC